MVSRFLSIALAATLIAGQVCAQNIYTPGPGAPPSTSGGGGSGCTVSGSANQVVINNGTTGCSSSALTITTAGVTINPVAGAASAPAMTLSGAPFTGGTGTTTFPLLYLNSGTAPTTFSTNGTELGVNAPSGFTGNLFDFHVNGAAAVASLSSIGALTLGSGVTVGASSVLTFNGRGVLSSPASATVQIGSSDAASPSAQTLRFQNVVTGTSNTAGQTAIIDGSVGTGTGLGGGIQFKFAPASTTGSTPNTLVNSLLLDANIHASFGGTAPAVTSCGTSPTIVGSDTAGEVTTGTATPASCTITFAIAYAAQPYCIVVDRTAAVNLTSYTVSTTAIVVTNTVASSQKLTYHCIGA